MPEPVRSPLLKVRKRLLVVPRSDERPPPEWEAEDPDPVVDAVPFPDGALWTVHDFEAHRRRRDLREIRRGREEGEDARKIGRNDRLPLQEMTLVIDGAVTEVSGRGKSGDAR